LCRYMRDKDYRFYCVTTVYVLKFTIIKTSEYDDQGNGAITCGFMLP